MADTSQTAEAMNEVVSLSITDDVAVITFDDGKANVVSFEAAAGLNTALDVAQDKARAVVLVGRDGMFSAGFDLAVMTGDDRDLAGELFLQGGQLCHRLFMHPQPVVAACTGHALALGAIALLGCDVRFAAEGPFKLGMTEVAIGMALPLFAVELARERLSKRHLQVATQHARVYDPSGARDAGFIDTVVSADAVESTAVRYAAEMAATLHPGAFAATRKNVRGGPGEAVSAALQTDAAGFA